MTGFSLGEIDVLLDEAAEKKTARPAAEDEPSANGLEGPPVSRAGDLWVLGPHRLLCGDAPLDCDFIVRRWQQYTGKIAWLDGSDRSFEDMEAARLAGPNASPATARGE